MIASGRGVFHRFPTKPKKKFRICFKNRTFFKFRTMCETIFKSTKLSLVQYRTSDDIEILFFDHSRFKNVLKSLFSLGEIIFNFTYDSPQNAYGKLETINYRNGKSLLLKYDYAMRINDIVQMPSGNKLKVKKQN